jgi:hypothetical protein
VGVESLPPEVSLPKRWPMRSLGVASEEEAIEKPALDDYAMVFQNPLSASQVRALAALFGWAWAPSKESAFGPSVNCRWSFLPV